MDHIRPEPKSIQAFAAAELARFARRRAIDWSATGLLLAGVTLGMLAVPGWLSPFAAIAATISVAALVGLLGYLLARARCNRPEVIYGAIKLLDQSVGAQDGLLTIVTLPRSAMLDALQVALTPVLATNAPKRGWLPGLRKATPWFAAAGLLLAVAGPVAGPHLINQVNHGPEIEAHRGTGSPDPDTTSAATPLRSVANDPSSNPDPKGSQPPQTTPKTGQNSETNPSDNPEGSSPESATTPANEPRTSVPTTLRRTGDSINPPTTSDQESVAADIPPPAAMPWERPIEVPGVTPRTNQDPTTPSTTQLPEVGERRRPPLRLPPQGANAKPQDVREEPMKILPEVRDGERKSVPVQRTVYRPGSQMRDAPAAAGDGTGDGGTSASMPEREPLARGALSEDELAWLRQWRAQFPTKSGG